jgi:hypothetical protein
MSGEWLNRLINAVEGHGFDEIDIQAFLALALALAHP